MVEIWVNTDRAAGTTGHPVTLQPDGQFAFSRGKLQARPGFRIIAELPGTTLLAPNFARGMPP